MPTKKLNFSLSPINDNPVSVSAANAITQGYTHKNGFPTIKFSIPAQDVLLDVGNLYLSGQIIVLDSVGAVLTTNATSQANYNSNNSDAAIATQNCVNYSNWNGVASVIDKVVVQSKKTQTELSTIINYNGYNALTMGHSNNEDDYLHSPLLRNVCAGVNDGFAKRKLINTPSITGSRIQNYNEKWVGQFFSFKLDVALLKSQMIHLGNDFSGGLLLTLHLSPDSAVFHTRFRKINAGTGGALAANGVQYVLKGVKLEGKYAVPTQQDLQSYNPVITMNSRVNLMNDIVSSENCNTYTPQLQMVKGIVNTYLDDNQQNNYTQNQNNFRVPLGLEKYMAAKNNIRFPNEFDTQTKPNSKSSIENEVSGLVANVAAALGSFTQNTQHASAHNGDSELRLQLGRGLTGGIMPSHTSATLELTNDNMIADYDADLGTSATVQRGDNTKPDLLGIATDYSNNIGQLQNFVNQDYELKVSSGVNTGRVDLPTGRANKISVQETYVRNFSQIDLRTLQKTQ
tara:strand:- start:15601 stop:17142 length:1542 start_codon:yes stop_codon:yes gene_type:complete